MDSAAFFLTIGTGLLSSVLLAGYNGYDGGSERRSAWMAAGITFGATAAMTVTDIQKLASRGNGHADIPGGYGEFLIWVFPTIALGLIAHRIGRYVENR